jgi:hypothetical protein
MTPIEEAVDAALFCCPISDGSTVISRLECEEMVRAAISTYLHETARALGETVGLCFCVEEEE